MSYLPGKKVVTALLFLVVLFTVIFVSGGGEKQNGDGEKVVLNDEGGKSIEKILPKDSDNDGLADWEEILWKTDPKNPDTDGDGTPDGEEVRSSRDPNLEGPDDFIEKTAFTRDSEFAITYSDLTKTDSLTIDLFSRYLGAKEAGIPIKKIQAGDAALDSFLANQEIPKSLPRFFPQDINTISSSKSNIERYGNALGLIFIKYEESETHGEPLEMLMEAAEERSLEKANRLKILSNDYFRAAQEIAKIPTPKSALALHLSLINELVSTGENVNALGDVLVDPIYSLQALSSYVTNSTLLRVSLENLSDYMDKNKVLYTPRDSGYVLFNDFNN
jgi:hypothetical protein